MKAAELKSWCLSEILLAVDRGFVVKVSEGDMSGRAGWLLLMLMLVTRGAMVASRHPLVGGREIGNLFTRNEEESSLLTKENELAQAANKGPHLQYETAEHEQNKRQSTITDLKTKGEEVQSLTKDNEELREDLATKGSKIVSHKKKLTNKDKLLPKEKTAQKQQQVNKTEIASLTIGLLLGLLLLSFAWVYWRKRP